MRDPLSVAKLYITTIGTKINKLMTTYRDAVYSVFKYFGYRAYMKSTAKQ